jgi:GT2 family glycosyltransferase
MTISVIIASYNRADLLDECLTHLSRQRFEPGDEVIVVDNASTDHTPQVIERRSRSFPVPLRYLHETRAGKSNAVACALGAARGELLAFTDDDVNVGEGWLDAIRKGMSDPKVALVGGPVAPRWEKWPPQWLKFPPRGYGRLASPLGLVDYGPAAAPLGERAALAGNLAIRRDVMTAIGGFRSDLGKLRGTLLSGEDHDLCQRVAASGREAWYCPEAVVHHWVPAQRMRVGYFVEWFYWSGITHAALDEAAARPVRSWFGIPPYLIRRAARAIVRATNALLRRRPAEGVDALADVAFAAGYVARRWALVTLDRPAPARAEGAQAA